MLGLRLALAAIALHVADDAFLATEPGTAAGDHLASGLVPIAIAALLALVAGRLRPGAQAVVALVCGVLAIAGGVAAPLRHALAEGPSGSDLTGLLALAAGVWLVGWGARTLWRTRRLDERPLRRYARRAALTVGALLGAFLVVFPAGMAIVATDRARLDVAAADLGAPYERVAFRTQDGLTLRGWYVPSRNGAAVIAFPGRSGPVRHARMLVRHGYGVLLFDRRGEGESDGDFNAFGWAGARDVAAATAFLRARDDVDPDRIGGLGLSVGGEMLLEAAAQGAGLRAVVSEGAGVRSLREHLDDPSTGRVQRWISNWVVMHAAVRVLSDTAPPPALTDLMARTPARVLLIRALDGNPDEVLNRAYRDSSPRRTELWEVGSGGHTGALAAHSAAYERRVISFFDTALAPEGGAS